MPTYNDQLNVNNFIKVRAPHWIQIIDAQSRVLSDFGYTEIWMRSGDAQAKAVSKLGRGYLHLLENTGELRVELHRGNGLTLRNADGSKIESRLQGDNLTLYDHPKLTTNYVRGDSFTINDANQKLTLDVRPTTGVRLTKAGQVITQLGRGSLFLGGGNDQPGSLTLRHVNNITALQLTTNTFVMRDATGKERVKASAAGTLLLGGNGAHGELTIRDAANKARIVLNAASGEIEFSNGDAAEEFESVDRETTPPGTVVVLEDARGRVRPCSEAYDTRVAGVISGAGEYRPGIVLDRKPDQSGARVPVALLGKVECLADAEHGPIEVGSLLTSSRTPGHAMRASDPARAFGAIIGKALTPLARGRGLVKMLVSLQ